MIIIKLESLPNLKHFLINMKQFPNYKLLDHLQQIIITKQKSAKWPCGNEINF